MSRKLSEETANLLLEMAHDLETLTMPEGARFFMGEWGSHKNTKDHKPEEKNYCGFSGCAIGWLTTMPKWQERGLIGEWVFDEDGDEWELLCKSPFNFCDAPDWFTTAQKVFDLPINVTSFFFTEGSHLTRQEFADKVKEWVRLRRQGYLHHQIETHMDYGTALGLPPTAEL